MSKILKAAKAFSGRSRMCDKCKHYPCSDTMLQVCHNAYVKGFEKGVFWLMIEHKKAKNDN